MPLSFQSRAVLGLAILWIGAAECRAQVVIGGTEPDRRPEAAPVAREGGLDEAARAVALKGVTKPYPASLGFLNDQGGWYTPFSHPGMTGPYDIRGWHKAKP